ncbi:asparaginase [Zavarzinia compransoris]|uniref:L-asparaginase 1 n=1 Tax=Zavarzinia compransoris TaxID=1264899 RepID=A0A317E5X6_9PROT|nr:asparaginase [Zavarzinia compransoris]PWR20783.1 L-asparaginase 1 [Zavarzinia compransoris]TDP44382.1 L-asparaginase [Zavarzinia compransoris]
MALSDLDLNRRILVVYVGGTIGMRQSADGLSPQRDLPTALAVKLAPWGGQLPLFSIESLDEPIDSAEAEPADWLRIARHIAERCNRYDGFVILHGTDTMAYTASALGFMLRGIDQPVIVTGAQVPLETPGSDALDNVVSALTFAACPALSGVGLAFDRVLYRGCRTTKVSSSDFAGFDSPNHPPLARLDDSLSIDAEAVKQPDTGGLAFELPDQFGATVLSLRVVPGMQPALLDALLDLGPQGLILECYGSGTVPGLGGRMLGFLERAMNRGVVVVALSQALHGGVRLGTYAAGSALVKAGVIDGRDLTFEAAFTKLHHLLAQGLPSAAVRGAFTRNLTGECRE